METEINFCVLGNPNTCAKSKWPDQKICRFSRRSPKRNCCIFYFEQNQRCDSMHAQNDQREADP